MDAAPTTAWSSTSRCSASNARWTEAQRGGGGSPSSRGVRIACLISALSTCLSSAGSRARPSARSTGLTRIVCAPARQGLFCSSLAL
eukprot:scaffold275092_cov37-Tisochrysis_lutea.AAC.1